MNNALCVSLQKNEIPEVPVALSAYFLTELIGHQRECCRDIELGFLFVFFLFVWSLSSTGKYSS